MARVFGVTDTGNFEHGTTVLSMPFPLAQVARALDLGEETLQRRLDDIRGRLLGARQQRPAPARDDKVLTSWNALMVAALAEAGVALGRVDYLTAARRGGDFLLRELRPAGTLLRTWKDGSAKITGFLEDSAFLADALVTLYEATADDAYFAAARDLTADALRRFSDGEVLYDTPSDAEPLLVRPRSIDDSPIPAGQSRLASALLRIAAITGETEPRSEAERIMGPFGGVVAASPLAVGALAAAMDRALAPSREVAIVGVVDDPRTLALVREVHQRWLPAGVLAWGDAEVGLLHDRPLTEGRPTAYVCESFTCRMPVTEPDELVAALRAAGGATT